MSVQTRKNKTRFNAFVASLCLHVIILACFAVAKFSHVEMPVCSIQTRQAALAQVKAITNSQAVMSKPKVKKTSSTFEYVKDKSVDIAVGDIFSSADIAGKEDIFEKSQSLSINADEIARPQSGQIEFFGAKAYQTSVCYVVDCSGSMKGLFGQVCLNLKQSISDLQADQYFNVIFFGDDRVFEFVPGQMIRASSLTKAKAYDFITSVEAKGKTNAVKALKKAVKLRDHCQKAPGVIYFLTDGFELSPESSNRFIDEIVRQVKLYASQTMVNTIGFWVQSDDCRILKTIADKTGGESVFINELKSR